MRVGWIGLGAMGSPMAGVLARAGHEVRAFDLNPALAQALAPDGVQAAASGAQAADGADVLAVMVATPAQAEAVLFGGETPLADQLTPGSAVLLLATVGLACAESVGSRLAERGVGLVDAPVSGGAARAATGDLLIMVGGPDAAVEQCRPLLEAMASSAPHVGPVIGDGQRMKLVNQILCGTHVAIAAEALGYADALGLDMAAAWEVLRHGAAQSFMFEDRGARMLTYPDADVKSALDIMHKDMGLVVEAAKMVDYPTPIAGAALQQYVAGRRAGLGRADDSCLIDVARGRAVTKNTVTENTLTEDLS